MNGKRFSLDDRIRILDGVQKNLSIRAIARSVFSAPSTVSRELKKHRILSARTALAARMPECGRIKAAPWVCDGCPRLSACHHRKYRYKP